MDDERPTQHVTKTPKKSNWLSLVAFGLAIVMGAAACTSTTDDAAQNANGVEETVVPDDTEATDPTIDEAPEVVDVEPEVVDVPETTAPGQDVERLLVGDDGVIFGAASGTRPGETNFDAIEGIEANLGATLPIVRRFRRWEDNLNSEYHQWLVDGGRAIHLSIKPTRDTGEVVLWRDIGAASAGSQIHDEMVRMANQLNELEGEIWLSFHHEPEAGDEASGTPDEFQDAWRNFRSVFEAEGVDATWVLTMTGFSYRVPETDVRSVVNWYPGDDQVDFVGADIYNWNNCRNNPEPWRSLESALDDVIEFADSRGKQIVLPEFGSDEGEPGAKGVWLDEVQTLMKEPFYSSRFAAILYFDTIGSEPDCNWLLESSPEVVAAAGRIAQDPFFRGGS